MTERNGITGLACLLASVGASLPGMGGVANTMPPLRFIGLVTFNDGRVPDFSPGMRSLWSWLREGSEVLRHTFSGFFVVTVADIILGEWWRWFAWRAAPPTP